MADDFSDNASTTGRLPIGGSATGILEASRDVDWFAVSVLAGLNYEFDITGQPGFTNASTLGIGVVTATSGVVAGNGTQTQITYAASRTETEYVKVVGGSATGGYTLTAKPLDDFSNNASTTGALSVGGTVAGNLQSVNDSDWFAVQLNAGTTYNFAATFNNQTNASAFNIELDSTSGIRVAGGSLVDIKQSFSFNPTTSATYYVNAYAIKGGSTGSYTISENTTMAGGTGTGAGTVAGGDVYRFFDSNFGTHFFTASASERASILASRPDLVNEGVGLKSVDSTAVGSVPVFRFFDSVHGTQFLTANAAERDTVQATRTDLKFEGINFYEDAGPQTGSAPTYRFFDSVYGTHFFTGSETERANILATRHDLVPEGIAFYAPT